jgi:hypothetical protein
MESGPGGMKLKLIQTGGIAGLTKSCQKEIDLSQQEVDDLVRSLVPSGKPGKSRDELNHVLVIGDDRKIHFSPEETTGKWKPTIDEMLSQLEFDKRNS